MNDSNNQHTGERQLHPSRLADLRVQLIRHDTVPIQLHTTELSMEDMHVECDRERAQLLAPPDVGEGRQFTARIPISAPGWKRRTLTLTVEVKSVVELEHDRYRVGLHFVSFFGKSRPLLDEFIAFSQN